MAGRTELDALLAQLEESWKNQDALFQIVSEKNDWNHKHGPDWTFADVPYHLAYFNHDLVLRGLEAGEGLSPTERTSLTSMEEINAWNARKFAERPANQTAEQSVAQLRRVWDDLKRLSSQMTDSDLDRPVWMPFMKTWATARHVLMLCLTHDWSEFMQLRIHLGLSEPVPNPATTNLYLGTMLNYFPQFLDAQAAENQTFTTVFEFTDAGVGPFTLRVAEGAASVSPGHAEGADLVLTQSAETWEKVFRRIQSFPDAVQSGALQVSTPERLPVFGQLFPM